jgi:uncharacterized protein YheU (UPF0270 family)
VEAGKEIEKNVAYVNEKKREAENQQKVQDIQNKIVEGEVCIFFSKLSSFFHSTFYCRYN